MSLPAVRPRTHWLAWMITGLLLLWWPLHHGYYVDEGYMAEMSARAMRGELPNTDFATNYLGLVYFLNAGWMMLAGKSLLILRAGLWTLCGLVLFPVTYRLARKLAPPPWAVATTLATLGLTIGMNFTVNGNWYALMMASTTIVLYWHLHGLERVDLPEATAQARLDRRKLMLYALVGGMLGITVLLKHTIGLDTGFAILLMMLDGVERSDQVIATRQKGLWVLLGLLLLVPLYLARLFLSHLSLWLILGHLLLPVGFTVLVARRLWRDQDYLPLQYVVKRVIVMGAAALLVGVLYLAPYAAQGSIGTLLDAVLNQYPQIYLNLAYRDVYALIRWQNALWLLWLVVSVGLMRWRYGVGVFLLGVGVLLFVARLLTIGHSWVHEGLAEAQYFYTQWPLWAFALSALWLYRHREETIPRQVSALTDTALNEGQTVRMLLIWAVFFWLNTYPLGVFLYVAYSSYPAWLLSGFLLYRAVRRLPVFFRVSAMGVLLAAALYGFGFAYGQVEVITSETMPLFPARRFPVKIPPPTGRVWVEEAWGRQLRAELEFIRKNSLRPDDVFTLTDEPVVYFLTSHINPTRYSYAIDSAFSDGRDVIQALEHHQVEYILIALNQNHFMQPLIAEYIATQFEFKAQIHPQEMVFVRRR
ncbi:MAG: hypothetical protein AB7P76_03960 [Candidatus Melainabacteria bacterium]